MLKWINKDTMSHSGEGAIALMYHTIVSIQNKPMTIEQDEAILNIINRLCLNKSILDSKSIKNRYTLVKHNLDTNKLDYYIQLLSFHPLEFKVNILNSIVGILLAENSLTDFENHQLLDYLANQLGVFGWDTDYALVELSHLMNKQMYLSL